jgi:hypothetical protein
MAKFLKHESTPTNPLPEQPQPSLDLSPAELDALDLDALSDVIGAASRDIGALTTEIGAAQDERAVCIESLDAAMAACEEDRVEELETLDRKLARRIAMLSTRAERVQERQYALMAALHRRHTKEYVRRSHELGKKLVDLALETCLVRYEYGQLFDEARAGGHEHAIVAVFHPAPIALDYDLWLRFRRVLHGESERPAPAADRFPVRLLKGRGPLNVGEIAGFSAELCWQMVHRGEAEWVPGLALPPGVELPPEPPKDPRNAPVPSPGEDGKIRVRFSKMINIGRPEGPGYRAGDVAAFDPETAEAIVRHGAGVFVESEVPR